MLQLVEPILEPFMKTQKDLEGAQYVTGSMTIPYIAQLRDGVKGAIVDLSNASEQGLTETRQKAMESVLPDAEALLADLINSGATATTSSKTRKASGAIPRASSWFRCSQRPSTQGASTSTG